MSEEAGASGEAIAGVARAAAQRLADEFGPGLVVQVEQALHADDGAGAAERYADPVAVGGLIVAVATLAWQVYTDLKARVARPAPEVVARTIRLRLEEAGVSAAHRDRVIEIVVQETTRQEPTA